MSLEVLSCTVNESPVTALSATVPESTHSILTFEEFYHEYRRDVLRWCSKFFFLGDEVQDAAQDVWLKVYLGFDQLDQSLNTNKWWLKRIVRNAAIDALRR